jgi:hypothetical protein
MKLAVIFATASLIGAGSLACAPSYAESPAPPQNALASTTSSAMPQQKLPSKSRPAKGEAMSATEGGQATAPAPAPTNIK